MVAAYGLTNTAFRKYEEKVIETMGEKNEKKIKDEIAKDIIHENR